jgi:3-methyladenine DNA glycosylase AlkD
VRLTDVLALLEGLGDPGRLEGMARFGITPDRAFGVSMPELRRLGREIGTDHELAASLWAAGFRETRILASIADDPELVTGAQMDAWTAAFDYWEICDQCCMNLFWRTPHAFQKAREWTGRDEEYVRRAGLALIAVLAWKDRDAGEADILALVPLVEEAASDSRTMIRKAADWALRQIGKRSVGCHGPVLESARRLADADDRNRSWVGRKAVTELTSPGVRRRLGLE